MIETLLLMVWFETLPVPIQATLIVCATLLVAWLAWLLARRAPAAED